MATCSLFFQIAINQVLFSQNEFFESRLKMATDVSGTRKIDIQVQLVSANNQDDEGDEQLDLDFLRAQK